MLAQPSLLSDQQWEVVLGSLMGDGCLVIHPCDEIRNLPGSVWGTGRSSRSISIGKSLCWRTSRTSRTSNGKGAVFADFTPLAELHELRSAVYLGDGKKFLSEDYLKALTPLALAIWYMDDGGFTLRSKGLQQRTEGGSGRIEICVEAMSEGSQVRLRDYLRRHPWTRRTTAEGWCGG